MKALRIHEHGDVDVLKLEDVPIPEPPPGHVRLKVAYAAMNHLDLWVRQGVPGHRFPLPITPGCDFSGTVDLAGPGAEHWKPGQRVTVAPGYTLEESLQAACGRHNLAPDYGIYGETCDGGNAEYAVVKSENLIPVPDDYPLDLAAAFPLTYLTAWHMLVTRCHIQPGDKVLIHAAGSGVSVASTQIAKLHGADVMVTAGSAEKVQKGLQNGADFGVNYLEEDWVAAAKAWSGGAGLDILVDHVGRDTLPQGIWLLARGGRVVTCGVTSGAEMKLHFAPIFFKSLSVLGSTMGGLGEMKQVAELVFSGKLNPIIYETFSLNQAQDAHMALSGRKSFGKLIFSIEYN